MILGLQLRVEAGDGGLEARHGPNVVAEEPDVDHGVLRRQARPVECIECELDIDELSLAMGGTHRHLMREWGATPVVLPYVSGDRAQVLAPISSRDQSTAV